MADNMDDDLPQEALPLQQDLTCPVCQGIFKDPSLLPCTHSFCRECLERSWQYNKKCPVCRQVFEEGSAIPNRALSSACESFLKQKNWGNATKPRGHVCHLHLKPLELYCEKDEEPVCVDCVTLHSSHRLLSIKDGAPMCRNELSFKVQIFEKKLDSFRKTSYKLTGQAEKQIKAEFERLHAVLHAEEARRLKALEVEEEQKISSVQDMIASAEKDIKTLGDLIETLKKEMGNEDLPLLMYLQSSVKSQWVTTEPFVPDGCLLDMGQHVGALAFNIWKNMKNNVQFLVLDPNTASPWLSLSPDLTSVKESPERMTVPENPERFDPCVFVLGAEGYTAGKHRWDINVGDNPKWIVGVCKSSVVRKKKFTVSTNRGVWAISLSKGVYSALTPERTELVVQQRPEKIRVKLNMDKGEVSFWDGGTAKHLVSFTHKFEERIFPIFGPGLHSAPMSMVAGKIAVHTS
uniref:Tripartite motif containing 35-28 n=1 Tax=Sphaeramia orbicularis TaxID=375764 RepID=A0A673CH42_9TELE